MCIVLTGISGFVGQNLASYLESKGFQIYGLSMRSPDWKQNFLPNADAIIHLAGKAHDTSSTSQGEEYFQVNRDLTIALYDEFLTSDVKDFFYFSSVKAVKDSVDRQLTEDISPSPLTTYGKSKLAAENYILSKVVPSGKRVFIIRPCMVHGPGNKGNLNLLYKIVEKNFPWPLGLYKNRRSFLSIDNLNFLISEMISKPHVESGIYNFADDEALSTNELVRIIGKSLNKSIFLWNVPKLIIFIIAKIGDALRLPLNSERLKKLTESYLVSNTKIKDVLGINNLPLTAKEGLTITIKSFNHNAKT